MSLDHYNLESQKSLWWTRTKGLLGQKLHSVRIHQVALLMIICNKCGEEMIVKIYSPLNFTQWFANLTP